MNEPKLLRKETITDKLIMKQKKYLIIAIMCVVTLLISSSYALLTNFDKSDEVITFQSGNLNMSINNTSGLINLNGKLPESDTDGLQNATPITLILTNTGTMKIDLYDVKLISDESKISTLSEEYIKYAISEDGINYSEPSILKDNNTIYSAVSLDVDDSKTLYLKVWIDEAAGNNALNKEYYGSIKVDLYQKKFLADFIEKDIYSRLDEEGNSLVATEEDGIVYLSGSSDQDATVEETDIDFNYVWYSGKLWRVTQINSDGSIKMITEKPMTVIAYGEDTNFYTDEENKSWIYQWLNEDFLDTLYNYENIIKMDSKWNVTEGPAEISTKLSETTMVESKVGLLNSYEYYKSYEKLGDYTNGYLNIGYYWKLSNQYDSSISINLVWCVNSDGSADGSLTSGGMSGVRPIINLKSTIGIIGGTGTKNDPYMIDGDKEKAESNTTPLNDRQSGEYVNFDGDLYRIVGIENNTTKLNKVDYIRDESNGVVYKEFSSSTTYGSGTDDTYWDYYLNNTWYNSISSNYKSMLEKGTYSLGIPMDNNYGILICSSVDTCTYSGYVGLPRYGEMFASQLGTGHSESSEIWLITPNDSSEVWYVGYGSTASNYIPSSEHAARPSIHLKSDVIIASGSGTENDPYEISRSVTNYTYITSYYVYNVSETGRYQIELWGASGGYGRIDAEQAEVPGTGGYTKGIVEMTEGESLYIYVGGRGTSPGKNTTKGGAGGYNGGGKGGDDNSNVADDVPDPGGGGGGATDVRYFGSTIPTTEDLVWNSTLGLNSRIMVAAGGTGSSGLSPGGYAGGLTGGKGTSDGAAAGTQTSGYAFGVGGTTAATALNAGPGGGGGGYYGGKSSSAASKGSGGGSSFISGYTGSVAITSSTDRTPRTGTDGAACANGTTDNLCSVHYSGKVFTSAVMIAGNATMPSTGGSTEKGHTGNGYARITYLGE